MCSRPLTLWGAAGKARAGRRGIIVARELGFHLREPAEYQPKDENTATSAEKSGLPNRAHEQPRHRIMGVNHLGGDLI